MIYSCNGKGGCKSASTIFVGSVWRVSGGYNSIGCNATTLINYVRIYMITKENIKNKKRKKTQKKNNKKKHKKRTEVNTKKNFQKKKKKTKTGEQEVEFIGIKLACVC